MKTKLGRIDQSEAREILQSIGAAPSTDYFSLSLSECKTLHEAANRCGYRKPKNANGSTSRCFFAYVQKMARQPDNPHFIRPTQYDHSYEPGSYGVCRRCGGNRH